MQQISEIMLVSSCNLKKETKTRPTNHFKVELSLFKTALLDNTWSRKSNSRVNDDCSGGSLAEWFRALVLQSGGPGFKSSTGFVFSCPRVQILGHALCIANWSASCQLGF